jgi:UDP-2,3-diacylglucosamine hydrolase
LRRLFVSDLHLDDDAPALTRRFAALVAAERARCDELYILGDLVEVWLGDDDDSALARELQDILAAAAQYCRVRLMHGNRDFLIGEQFCRDAAIELIPDPCVINVAGRRALLCHGDELCTDDIPYQQLRATLRSAPWQHDMLARPLSERRLVGAELRARSRASNANKPAAIMDVAPTAVTHAVRNHAADLVIHGHTHRPGRHRHFVDGRKVERIVLGPWLRCGWLLRLSDHASRLECFGCAAH